MIKTFFVQSQVLIRMKDGLIGPYLPAVGTILQQQGYATDTIRRHLRTGDTFDRWLSNQGLSIGDVNHSTVDRYIGRLGHLVSASTPNG
jgi:hypothetical protein